MDETWAWSSTYFLFLEKEKKRVLHKVCHEYQDYMHTNFNARSSYYTHVVLFWELVLNIRKSILHKYK